MATEKIDKLRFAIVAALNDFDALNCLRQLIVGMLGSLNVPYDLADHFFTTELYEVQVTDFLSWEQDLIEKLRKLGIYEHWPRRLSERCSLMFEQLKPYLDSGCSVVDVGCGSGDFGRVLAQSGYQVGLADTIDWRTDRVAKKLPFTFVQDDYVHAARHAYDVATLCTVLHHSDNPELLLEECCRVAKHRVVILESVTGVEAEYRLHRHVTTVVDWFYNNVFTALGTERVNVPLNFKPVAKWVELAERFTGRKAVYRLLGADQRLNPLYHVIIVV